MEQHQPRSLIWPLTAIAIVISVFFGGLIEREPSGPPLQAQSNPNCNRNTQGYPLCQTQTAAAGPTTTACARENTTIYPICVTQTASVRQTQTAAARQTGSAQANPAPAATNTNPPAAATNTPTNPPSAAATNTPTSGAPTPAPTNTSAALPPTNTPAAAAPPSGNQAQPSLVPTEVQVDFVCRQGEDLVLAGVTAPNTPLLLAFNQRPAAGVFATPAPDRYIGGTVSNGRGRYQLRFRLGEERSAIYDLVVRIRASGTLVETKSCFVPPVVPTSTPRNGG